MGRVKPPRPAGPRRNGAPGRGGNPSRNPHPVNSNPTPNHPKHPNTMKPQHVIRFYENSNTPAALLAAWQNLPLATRRQWLREHSAPGYPCRPCGMHGEPDVAKWRRAAIHDPAFMAAGYVRPSPADEHGRVRLWLEETSPEIRDMHKGTGWYSDDYYAETIAACGVILESFPGLVFGATLESAGGMLGVELTSAEAIDFDGSCDEYQAGAARREAMKDAARWMESTAERMADDERRYQEEQREEMERDEKAREARETIADLRPRIRALVAELKQICGGTLAATYPAAAAALRQNLAGMLDERREAFETIRANP